MAQAQHLPIYSAAYNYVKEMYRLKLKLPKVLNAKIGASRTLETVSSRTVCRKHGGYLVGAWRTV